MKIEQPRKVPEVVIAELPDGRSFVQPVRYSMPSSQSGRHSRGGNLAAMSPVPMVASPTDVPLVLAPINRSWIRAGNPQARNMVLSRSLDGRASTMIWDCTAGKFEWHYEIDETIYFLEGEVAICDRHSEPKIFKAGDVLYLPCGAICDWQVETYVRKLAFCRRPQPRVFGLVRRGAGIVKRTLFRGQSGP